MPDCKRCLQLGHRCAATHETEAGEPSCVFCLDSVPCPVQRKRQRAAREQKGAQLEEESAANTTDVKGEQMETTLAAKPETHATTAPKKCRRPGCTTEIGPRNRSGLCARHFHWREAGKRRSSAGDSHVAPRSAGANGHARTAGDGAVTQAKNGSNGAARDPVESFQELGREFVEDRLDRLILGLTVAEKTRIATAWMRGEI
jgi:hypothetical protein